MNAALEALTSVREATQPLRSFTAKSVASTRDVAGIFFTATQASGHLVGFQTGRRNPGLRSLSPDSLSAFV